MKPTRSRLRQALLWCWLAAAGCVTPDARRPLEWIAVSKDGSGFVSQPSGRPFTPWGFNYDHDRNMRLIEDYWETEWPTVESDFQEMKSLGANVVRVHLQFGRFMTAPGQPNARALARLGQLLALCDRLGLYLDLTGLACYRKQDTPPWYDALGEPARWAAQADFWRAIARHGARHASVWAYDLMNEPCMPGERLAPGEWLHPATLGGFSFVQRLALDAAGRDAAAIYRAWTRQLAAAIRQEDRRHLVTVGLLPFGGAIPRAVAPELDYISVHIYPKTGQVDEALRTLDGFRAGKPVVIEETFPLSCSAEELGRFIEQSKGRACGWIGFYWGQTPDELRGSKKIGDVFTLNWLELFQRMNPNQWGP